MRKFSFVGSAATALAALTIPLAAAAQLSHTTQSPRSGEPGFVGGAESANWEQAARWAPYNTSDMLYSLTVAPRWISGTDNFWYQWEDNDGRRYYLVDPARRSKTEMFNRDALAAQLTRITRDPVDGQNLGIRGIRFVDGNTFYFEFESTQDEEVEAMSGEEEGDSQEENARPRPQRPSKKVFHFEFDIDTQTLRELDTYEEPDSHPGWANVSPDGQTVVFARDHNLFMITGDEYQQILDARRGKTGDAAEAAEDSVDVNEVQLTTDGEAYYSYMANSSGRGTNDVDKEEEWAKRNRAGISWSHDSQKFAMTRSDQREVGMLFVIHNTGQDRPELESYTYDMPGEENVTQTELLVFDMASRQMTQIDDDPWKDQTMSVVTASQFRYPDDTSPFSSKWFTEDSNELWFTRSSRDLHRIDLMKVDLTSMEVTAVVEERLNTYQEQQGPDRLSDGSFVWWSERDGWAHLYRYAADGTLLARLTEGPWHVDGVVRTNAANQVFFTANGREEGIDPYYVHLYRVNADGSGLVQVSEGDFDNRVSMPESGNYAVHSFSRVNTVPESVVRGPTGAVIMELETADLSRLMEAGWQMPEPFKFEAADGYTDIYGVMYKPFDFDPNKVYPIIEYVYPGPQTESVSKFFTTNSSEVGLAQLGFIVVTLGNRGGHPDRSKWYHNYSYGNLRDYGLADKVAGIEQLADRHRFIDRNRVGIYGHSGGGFMSTAAMLNYPDIFDVAVSSSGNHDNQIYNRWWSETHHGVDEVTDDDGEVSFEYDIDSNISLAANLQGKLLLTTGDVDNNVHPALTIRMAHALIQANKRFDYFLFPSQRHGYGSMSNYWFWLRAEYFARHLLGDSRTAADVAELRAERERN